MKRGTVLVIGGKKIVIKAVIGNRIVCDLLRPVDKTKSTYHMDLPVGVEIEVKEKDDEA